MKKKKFKKIISAEEFFRLKEMFSGLAEDRTLALEVYNNSNFQDKEIVDLLMAKALTFEPRKKFCDAIKFVYNIPSKQNIYAFLKEEEANEIYYNILKDMGYE